MDLLGPLVYFKGPRVSEYANDNCVHSLSLPSRFLG